MVKAGYDPRGMLGVMQVLKKASGGRGGAEWMQSHPLPDTRIQQIAQLIESKYKKDQLAQLSEGRKLRGLEGGGRPAASSDRERW
jgi:predicted Zn-dependent protease